MRKNSTRNTFTFFQAYHRFWKAHERFAQVRSDFYRMQAQNVELQGRWFRMMADFWAI